MVLLLKHTHPLFVFFFKLFLIRHLHLPVTAITSIICNYLLLTLLIQHFACFYRCAKPTYQVMEKIMLFNREMLWLAPHGRKGPVLRLKA